MHPYVLTGGQTVIMIAAAIAGTVCGVYSRVTGVQLVEPIVKASGRDVPLRGDSCRG